MATTTPHPSRRALLVAVPALAAATLAAPTLVRAASPPTLIVGDQKGGLQSVLKAAGLLDAAPVRLEFKQFGAAAPLLEALNAGAVDVAGAGDAPTAFALAAGVSARIVAATRGTGASTAVVVPGNSPITDVPGLRGQSVGTNRGSIGHFILLALAARHGWKPEELRIANLMPSEARAAMTTGAVAAWSTWNTYVAQARLNDNARVVIDGRDGLMTGLSFQVATTEAIAGKREALAAFLRLAVAGRRWALDHPDAYARALAAEIGVSDAVAALAFDTERPRPVPVDAAVVADEQRVIDLCAGAGLLRRRLDAASVVDASFNDALG